MPDRISTWGRASHTPAVLAEVPSRWMDGSTPGQLLARLAVPCWTARCRAQRGRSGHRTPRSTALKRICRRQVRSWTSDDESCFLDPDDESCIRSSRSCCRTSAGKRSCALRRPRALAWSLWSWRHSPQLHPAFQRAKVPCAARLPRRRPSGSVRSRTSSSCCCVQGGSGISPSESQRRTTGGDTLHTAAACRIEVISPGSLTN